MSAKFNKSQQITLTVLAVLMSVASFHANCVSALLGSYDTGWIIATGQYILHHGIPSKDIFSWTNVNSPLIAYQWLFAVWLAVLYKIGSLWLVGLATCVAVGLLVFFVLPNSWTKKGIPLFLPLFFIALVLTPNWFNARPQLCSYFLLYIFITILERNRLFPGNNKWLFALPLLMLLWANLHSFCFIGLLIMAIYLACQIWREKKVTPPLLVALALSALATQMNPYGPNLAAHAESFINSSQYLNIWELRPWLTIEHFTWTILFAPIAIALFIVHRKSIPLEGFLITSTALAAALAMRRFEPVFVIASWEYLGQTLSTLNWSAHVSSTSAKPFSTPVRVTAAVTIGLVCWCLQCYSATQAWILFTEGGYPFLRTVQNYIQPARERIFCPPVIGSWLICLGAYPVFIDTRFDMYPKNFVQETNNCLEGRTGCLNYLDSWKISQLLTKDDYPLTRELVASPLWQPILDDGVISWWIKQADNHTQTITNWGLADNQVSMAHLPPYIISSTIEFRCAKYLQQAEAYRQLGQMELAKETIAKGLKLMPQAQALLKKEALCR
jgi:hypothetical protein